MKSSRLMLVRPGPVHPAPGFTLQELLVALMVLAIILSFALPAMQSLLLSFRLSQRVQLLSGTLQSARSEAIRRNQPVHVCALNSKVNLEIQGCQVRPVNGLPLWNKGVLVFADAPGKPVRQYDRRERLDHALFAADDIQVDAPFPVLTFTAQGRLQNLAMARFTLQDRAGQRCVSVEVASHGRSRICSGGGCCDAPGRS